MFGLYYQDHAPYGLVTRSFMKHVVFQTLNKTPQRGDFLTHILL